MTIQYTCPTENLFTKTSALVPTATKILELIIDLNLEESPILFHVFSNGGAILYKHIVEVLHRDSHFRKVRVMGTIFDSGPCPTDAAAGARAFVASQGEMNAAFRLFLSFAVIVYVYIVSLIHKILTAFGSSRKLSHADFWESMKKDPSRWPQMFLYSKADKVVPESAVREMADHRRRLGVETMQHCWEDSDHVMHFRNHTDAYIKECHYFLALCLNRRC